MADRTYSKAFEINRAAPAFLYIEDPTLNNGSGGWRPFRTTDSGGGGGTISGDVNVSGIGQLILDTDELEALGHSGNAFLNTIALDTNFLRTGIRNCNIINIVGITGTVGATVTNTVGVTGTVGVAGTVGVTGTRVDSASGYAQTNFLMGGGRAVEVSSGFNPQYGSGANAAFNIDRANGALLVEQTDLNFQFDSVVAYPLQNTNVSNTIPSGSFTGISLITGQALPLNSGRKAWFIANTSSVAPLYVRFSSAPASVNAFSMILNPASVAGQQGSSWSENPANYLGPVSVSGQGFVSWEL